MKTPRRMVGAVQVWRYWRDQGYRGDRHVCMHCGWGYGKGFTLDRAHIVAHMDGGAGTPDNLVLVDPFCHVLTDGWTAIRWWSHLAIEREGLVQITPESVSVLAERMRGRTKTSLAAAKARGVRLGNPNVFRATEAAKTASDRFADSVIDRVKPLRDQGLTLREIANSLNASGIRSARGAGWSATQISDLLRRAA